MQRMSGAGGGVLPGLEARVGRENRGWMTLRSGTPQLAVRARVGAWRGEQGGAGSGSRP